MRSSVRGRYFRHVRSTRTGHRRICGLSPWCRHSQPGRRIWVHSSRHPHRHEQSGWITDLVRRAVLVRYPPTWEQRLAIATTAECGQASRRATVQRARLFAPRRARGRWWRGTLSCGPLVSTVERPQEIVVHQTTFLTSADRYERDGLPCTGLARTLVDLGSSESEDMVWRALISAQTASSCQPAVAATDHAAHSSARSTRHRRDDPSAETVEFRGQSCPTRGSRNCCGACSIIQIFRPSNRSTCSLSETGDFVSANRSRDPGGTPRHRRPQPELPLRSDPGSN